MRLFLHTVNPSLKLIMLLVSFIGLLFIEDTNIILRCLAVVLTLYLTCVRLSFKQNLILFLVLSLLFLSTATSMIFFGKGTTTLFRWGLIHITQESYHHGFFLGVRALVFAFLGILFSLTTKPVLLFYSLMQQLRIKPRYAYCFMAAIRLFPLIMEEFQIIRRAMYVRGRKKRWGRGAVFQQATQYTLPLLAQSIRKAYWVAIAMEAKRFSSSNSERTFYYLIRITVIDCFFILFVISVFFLLTI